MYTGNVGCDERRGRPGPKPKPVEQRRRNRVMLNLDDDEYQRLLDAARDDAPSTYVRRVLMRHLRRRS